MDDSLTCNVSEAGGRCARCGIPHPGFPLTRKCKTVEQIIAESARQTTEERTATTGPGTELKKLLAGWPFRLVAGADCKCNQRATYMDAKGCDWVEANIEECVGYLRESAADRGLPFLDAAGRVLVRRAIHNARKAEAARAQEAQQKGPPAV